MSLIGIHSNNITLNAAREIETFFLLVKRNSSGDVEVNGATDEPIGICTDQAHHDGDPVNVNLLGIGAHTQVAVASEAIPANSNLFTSADGKVSKTSASGSYKIGKSLTTATEDGDEIEFIPCYPVKQS